MLIHDKCHWELLVTNASYKPGWIIEPTSLFDNPLIHLRYSGASVGISPEFAGSPLLRLSGGSIPDAGEDIPDAGENIPHAGEV